jgi:hypothetical protein
VPSPLPALLFTVVTPLPVMPISTLVADFLMAATLPVHGRQ